MSQDFAHQVEYYNRRWKDSDYAGRLKLRRAVSILQAIESTGLSTPRMCDLGCGPGWLTAILGVFGPTVGVDLSDVAIEAAATRYGDADFICANVMDWSPPKEPFDIVVSQEVVEHIGDQQRYMQIAAGLLRSGGYLILTTPNLDTVKALPASARSDQPVENWVSRTTLHELAARYFTEVNIRTIVFGHGQAGMYRVINSGRVASVLRYVRLDTLWESWALQFGFGLHLLLVARKQ